MSDNSITEVSMLDVYLGREIGLSQAYSLTSASEPKLILVIGPHDAGKTTFISRLFDLFLDGPINDWKFVASETIVGFEKLLASYRTTSSTGRPRPSRTALNLDPEILHLCVSKTRSNHSNLLIGNLSGEIFNDLIKSDEALTSIKYFKQADHVSITLDGSKMTNRASRHMEIRNASMFLERLTKSGLLSDDAVLSIMLFKADILNAHTGGQAYIDETLNKIEEEIIKPISSLNKKMHSKPIQIIAEPFSACSGFDSALEVWTKNIPVQDKRSLKVVKSGRAIDKFKAKRK
jgi:hypothetical protein